MVLPACSLTHRSGGQELSAEELGDIRRRQEREQQLAAKYPGIQRKVHTLDNIHAISIGYIPGQRDIRPVISRGRGQCLSGAEEVPRRNESTGLSQGMYRVLHPAGQGYN